MTNLLSLSPAQRVAAVLAAMGAERAASVLKKFGTNEIRSVVAASEKLEGISQDQLNTLIVQFENEFDDNDDPFGGEGGAASLIEASLSTEQLNALAQGPEASRRALKKKSIWELLGDVEDHELMGFLCEENQYVAGYALTKLPNKVAAELIKNLPDHARPSILAGMITERPPLSMIDELVETVVKNRFERLVGATKSSGGQKMVAGLLNELNQEMTDEIFEGLHHEVGQDNIQQIKSMMFRFEDIHILDSRARSIIFDQTPSEKTILALRNAPKQLVEAVLDVMGQRTRRMVESELAAPYEDSDENIVIARKEIASLVLELAGKGEIDIPSDQEAA